MNLTLRQLRIFEAVARLLSFTRAAEELHLTHPAVSMQIKQLEQGVEAGLGLALLSAHTLEMESALKRLVILDVEGFPVVRDWYIVHRAGKRLSTLAQAFKAFIMRVTPDIIPAPEMRRSRSVR